MLHGIRLVAACAVVAVLAGSGLAWAADDAGDSERGDTFFTFGYDVENHLLVTGIHPVQAVEPVDCTVTAGTYSQVIVPRNSSSRRTTAAKSLGEAMHL